MSKDMLSIPPGLPTGVAKPENKTTNNMRQTKCTDELLIVFDHTGPATNLCRHIARTNIENNMIRVVNRTIALRICCDVWRYAIRPSATFVSTT